MFQENPSDGNRDTVEKVLFSSSKVLLIIDQLQENIPFVAHAWTVQGVMFHENSSKGNRGTPEILPSSHNVLLIIHLPQPNLHRCSACGKYRYEVSGKSLHWKPSYI